MYSYIFIPLLKDQNFRILIVTAEIFVAPEFVPSPSERKWSQYKVRTPADQPYLAELVLTPVHTLPRT